MANTTDKGNNKKPILVSGIPRTGSTWLAKTLSYSNGTQYVHEPDDEKSSLLALIFKKKMHRYPYIKKSDINNNYYTLFYNAFYGNERKRGLDRTYKLHQKIYRRLFSIDPNFIEKMIQTKCEYFHNFWGGF